MAQPSSSSVDRRRGFRAFALASMSLGFGLLVLAMPSAKATQPTPDHTVTLCHATSSDENPYVELTVDIASVKFLGHHSHADDIIPAFTIGNLVYPGKNVPAGQAILDNECNIPDATTTTSVEETTTSSSSTSTTVEETTTSTSTTVEETTTSTSTTVEASSTTVEDTTTTAEASTTSGIPTTVLAEFLTAPDDLPKTGDDATPMAAAGVAFIALGVAVLALQRRLLVVG
jgi:LPXTG-motif cell wall-anchored protein